MSRATFTVPIYQRRIGGTIELVTLGLGASSVRRSAQGIPKAEEQLRNALREVVRSLPPVALGRFDLKRGTRLERLRLSVTLKDAQRRKITGLFPLIVEPRPIDDHRTMLVCYHPLRPGEWFPADRYEPLEPAAAAYFGEAWAALDDEAILALHSNTKDSLRVLSFDAPTKTLLDELPSRKRGVWDDLEVGPAGVAKKDRTALTVLPRLGTDLTVPAAGRDRPIGLPRSPYREQLSILVSGARRRSVIVVGAPGAGKSTITQQLVRDLLVSDDYASHRNLDKVTHVWRLSGKQLIAGMSRVGEWEQRCVELLADVRGRRILLLVPDLHLFGRIGRARDSERALSDFFRGPVARGELVVIGESTPEQLRRLEEDDPAFVASLVRLHVHPATRAETFRMMLARARDLEVESPESSPLAIEPLAFETILQLGEGLFPSHALPGKAIDLLVSLCSDGDRTKIDAAAVLEHLSKSTGLPSALLTTEPPISVAEIGTELGARVMGQPVAVREAAELVVRIRAGLTDPKRPYGVLLFTGPTGTGKTELAKALAEYLYGSSSRLVRIDMSELSGGDGVARLIGDDWNPNGQLTTAVLAQPFSVVLLDEIEKAHPAVLNLLLQLAGDGRLTDAVGTTVSFTQTVVIMTSNLGARQRPPVGFEESSESRAQDIARAVREFFPPELFNRIDTIVPFAALTPAIAIDVTKKELAKLFARSGLVERNVFVQVGRAAIERIAKDSLRAEDGARSLKRFIEDRIGSLLAESIAKNPGASLQVLRIHDTAAGHLRIEGESLVEAQPVALRFALEPLLHRTTAELAKALPDALAALERIEASDRLVALSDQLRHHLGEHNRGRREHGALLYNIDWMRTTIETLRERLELILVASRDLQHLALENAIAERETTEYARYPWRTTPRPKQGRLKFAFERTPRGDELFATIAETYVLDRALDRVAHADEHAVFLELLPFGAGRGFLEAMIRAYSRARGEVDSVAWVREGMVSGGEGIAELERVFDKPADLVVMKIVGLSVRDYLELETGTHVWQRTVQEPELLRVRVLPTNDPAMGEALTAARHAATFLAAREEADREDSAGGARPDRLLPVVRTIRFDPPLPRRPPALLEMEDYVLGMPVSLRATSIADAFATLWLLRASRVEPGHGEDDR